MPRKSEPQELEKDVLKRFGDDDLMWVIVWGDLVVLQQFMDQHQNISLEKLNNGISAANFMSYMANSDKTVHFKRMRDALKMFRNNLYPHEWATRLSNLADTTLEMFLSPLDWLNNIFSETIIEISTDTSIPELEKIDAAADADDDLQIPKIGYENEMVRPLVMNLKNYFQQKLDKLDAIIISVETELEKEYELHKRLELIREWDNLMAPLRKNNAVSFCEVVQQYMQKPLQDEETGITYTTKEQNKGLLFNAPQRKVEYSETLLKEAQNIGSKLKNRNTNL